MHSTDELTDGYLGSGKRLAYSLAKYGKENHVREVLEFCVDRNTLKEREREIVDQKMIENSSCMNLMKGNGTPSMPGIETKSKISLALTGRILSDEHRRNIANSNRGKHFGPVTVDHKQKISQANRGKISWIKGRMHTDEARQKMSDRARGNTRARGKRSEEQKRRIAEGTRKALQKLKEAIVV